MAPRTVTPHRVGRGGELDRMPLGWALAPGSFNGLSEGLTLVEGELDGIPLEWALLEGEIDGMSDD
jgi:hypothetical protein